MLQTILGIVLSKKARYTKKTPHSSEWAPKLFLRLIHHFRSAQVVDCAPAPSPLFVMAYRRRYSRSFRGKKDRYSVERTVFNTAFSAGTVAFQNQTSTVVAATSLQGMRKVKHLAIDIIADADRGTDLGTLSFGYALYYVPAGTTVQQPNWNQTVGDLMPTNQFVISSGTFTTQNNPVRIRSRLARNLNSGDAIFLTVTNLDDISSNTNPVNIHGFVSYAITLQ